MNERITDEWGFFTAMPECVIEMWPSLGTEAVAIFLYLRYMTNRERKVAFPSYERMQQATGMRFETIKKALGALETAGLLTIKKRYGSTTIYKLHRPIEQDPPDVGVSSPPTGGELMDQNAPSSPTGGGQSSDRRREPKTDIPKTEVSSSAPLVQMDEEILPEEPRRVAVGNEFEDGYSYSDGTTDSMRFQRKRPKWQEPDATAMVFMAHWGKKWFTKREERTIYRQMQSMLMAKLITDEWIREVLSWAIKHRSQIDKRPRWSFMGFLQVATDAEKYRDWEIRRANAKGEGRADPDFGSSLEAIDAYYGQQ